MNFLSFNVFSSTGNGGSESFYRIEKSFTVLEIWCLKNGSNAQILSYPVKMTQNVPKKFTLFTSSFSFLGLEIPFLGYG